MINKKSGWKRWKPLATKLAVGYGLFCGALYFQQQRLMFFPTRQLAHTPSLYDLKYQDVQISVQTDAEQLETLHGWWIPAAQSDAPVMLYFHHNAINIGANVSQALQFHELGYSIFLFDYRGFGQSEGGFPHEDQLYQDAQAVWHYLTQQRSISPGDIVIYGHSVGGAIAIDLAAKQPDAAALIVQSSFTSMRDMTKRFGLYWLLPVELLLTQQFESLAKMESVQMPVLVLTGTSDVQIPVAMGERLHEAAPEAKRLVVIEGGGHDNHLAPEHKQVVAQFIDQALQE